jgi:transcriptional regulator with XRE-family HTH domain
VLTQHIQHKTTIMSLSGNTIDWYGMSDPAIIQELGTQLKRIRLQKNMSQQELALKSGLYRSTISEIENGRTASLLSFIQVLRGLEKLDLFGSLTEDIAVSPLSLAREAGLIRKRASSPKTYDTHNPEEGTW